MHVTKHRTIDPACLENPRPEGAESGEHRFAIFVSSPNTFFRKVEGYSGLHLHRQVSYPTVTTGKLVENPKEEPEGMRESTRNFREKIHSKDRDPLHSNTTPWLRPFLGDFMATTGGSAPGPRFRTLILVGLPLGFLR